MTCGGEEGDGRVLPASVPFDTGDEEDGWMLGNEALVIGTGTTSVGRPYVLNEHDNFATATICLLGYWYQEFSFL